MIYEGIVTLLPEKKISKKGITYAKFTITDSKQAILQVVLFGTTAERALTEVTIGSKVTVDGTLDTSSFANPNLQTIKAQSFTVGSKTGEGVARGKTQGLGVRPYSSDLERHRINLQSQGYCKVRTAPGRFEWKRKTSLIMVNGEIQDPMDFCFETLGKEKMEEIARGGDFKIKDVVGLAALDSGREVRWLSED